MDKLKSLLSILKIEFQSPDLLTEAFTHRSYLNETKKITRSNERLEFLGDSILSFLTSEFLYKKYPQMPEGYLTNLRSSIVKTSTLAQISATLNLGTYLLLSRGEEDGGGRQNPSLLADTFEAFLGALYLDQGLKPAITVLQTYLFPRLDAILEEKSYKDAKSVFQEKVQEETKISPLYKVTSEEGPDHSKEFTIGVYVGEKLWGEGKGKSKQLAQQEAAACALEKWSKK